MGVVNPEDDFGFSRPRGLRTKRATGIFTPRHLIGRTVADVPREHEVATPEVEVLEPQPQTRFNGIRDLVRLATSRRQNKAAIDGGSYAGDGATPSASSTPRQSAAAPFASTPKRTPSAPAPRGKASNKEVAFTNMMESQLDDLVFHHDIDRSGKSDAVEKQEQSQQTRRLKRPVLDKEGKPMDVQKPSDPFGARVSSIKHCDYKPEPVKDTRHGAKRQFSWIHRPTAWNNPVTYEEPCEPGERAPHPISAAGLVATDRKRVYPEKNIVTGVPPPHDPSKEEVEDQEFRNFVGGCVKRVPEMSNDTSWLTEWHWDSRHDVVPPKQNKYSLGFPIESCTYTHEQMVHSQAAGKHSGLQAEGSGLSWYDKVRKMDEAAKANRPRSAR